MYTFITSSVFDDWFTNLQDPIGKARILARIRSAELGNFGDSEPVGDGVSEMRIHIGPGYRVYYIRTGKTVYVLLCGGDKATQRRDISQAKLIAKELKGT